MNCLKFCGKSLAGASEGGHLPSPTPRHVQGTRLLTEEKGVGYGVMTQRESWGGLRVPQRGNWGSRQSNLKSPHTWPLGHVSPGPPLLQTESGSPCVGLGTHHMLSSVRSSSVRPNESTYLSTLRFLSVSWAELKLDTTRVAIPRHLRTENQEAGAAPRR